MATTVNPDRAARRAELEGKPQEQLTEAERTELQELQSA
jgi:hypothetical protein